MAKLEQRNCELCDEEAVLYCSSDSAFLCRRCDAKVHGANFLVARHVRSVICSSCRNLNGRSISGAGVSPTVRLPCRSCSPASELDGDGDGDGEGYMASLSSSSSSCVSSTTDAGDEVSSSRKRREKEKERAGRAVSAVDFKVEGILVNWCKKLDVEETRVLPTAIEVLTGMTVLPFRVSLAVAFWMAVRFSGHYPESAATCQALRRVEQISGVPAKLILATESRLARVLKRGGGRRSRADHEEGWAEC